MNPTKASLKGRKVMEIAEIDSSFNHTLPNESLVTYKKIIVDVKRSQDM